MAKDPYKYFRVEARELLEGLSQGVLQLERDGSAPDVVSRLLRLAHTLKGAARVVKQPAIADFAHTAEGILTGHRDSGNALSKEESTELLRLLDGITERLSVLEPAREAVTAVPVRVASDEPLETLRVEIRDMDALLRRVTEAGVQLGAARRTLSAADRVGERTAALLSVDLERLDGELEGIRDVAHRLRLIPAQTVFPSLERSVRDAAETLGRRVTFEATGGEVRLDANVLASLRDALMHVVRNAVAHGIEIEGERLAAGKPPAGQVRLVVERRGGRVAFVCADDGRGVDVEAVRRAVVASGKASAAEAASMPVPRILTLLHAGGLSTSRDVTELSGRGIGLDVVRETAAKLKGEMRIRSEPGRGATIEILVPMSLASLQALVVEAGDAVAAIPLDAVQETLRVPTAAIARSAESESILHEGAVIPFVPLAHALRSTGTNLRNRTTWSAVVVHSGGRRVALGVDRLLGTSSVVLRALPPMAEADPVVAGVSLDAEGHPQLVLDAEALAAAAERGRGIRPQDADVRPDPILVVDDSLTTRMLEKSILESAGYVVELATSAEEGLAKARERRYSLFLVDVEMPGMSGFDFVAETRADENLRGTPAILVTSRNAPEDLRRGEQVGARAYVVKGEFDQAGLLRTIRTLVG